MPAVEGRGSSWARWLDQLKTWAPLAATLFGVLYAAGFVVVNAFFAQYGIRDLDAVRVRYVSTGIMFLLVISLPIYGSYVALGTAQRMRARKSALWFAPLAFGLLAGPVLASLVELTVLARAYQSEFSIDADRYFRPVSEPRLVFGLISVNLIVFVMSLAARLASRAVGHPRLLIMRNALATLVVLSAIGVVVVYSTSVYGYIPQWLGGGRLEYVRLVVTPVIAEACPQCASTPVLLVDEDSSRVVVVVRQPNGALRGVVMRGGEVKAIINE